MEEKEVEKAEALEQQVAELKKEKASKGKGKGAEASQGSSALVKTARNVMKRHGLKVGYVTADGQTFASRGNAKSHAANLSNKEVTEVKA